jgi:hypothetical protein
VSNSALLLWIFRKNFSFFSHFLFWEKGTKQKEKGNEGIDGSEGIRGNRGGKGIEREVDRNLLDKIHMNTIVHKYSHTGDALVLACLHAYLLAPIKYPGGELGTQHPALAKAPTCTPLT